MLQNSNLSVAGTVDSASNLRTTLCASVPTEAGVYCWWFDEDGMKAILEPLLQHGIDLTKIQSQMYNGKTYFALYFGLANKNLRERLNWHINQHHTPSLVKNGYLSTLRQTFSALLGIDETKSEKSVNDFMNEHCVVEWWQISATSVHKVETAVINSGYFPLNIQGNNRVAKEVRTELSKLRKIVKK